MVEVNLLFKIYVVLSVFELRIVEPVKLLLHESLGLDTVIFVNTGFVHVSKGLGLGYILSHVV